MQIAVAVVDVAVHTGLTGGILVPALREFGGRRICSIRAFAPQPRICRTSAVCEGGTKPLFVRRGISSHTCLLPFTTLATT
jgi:hypothetical protein